MGMVFHAVQDFYAHANWLVLLNAFTRSHLNRPSELPKWEELFGGERSTEWDPDKFGPRQAAIDKLKESNTAVSETETSGGLQTSAYPPGSATVGGKKPWGHRHPDLEGPASKGLARRATAQWKDYLVGLLAECKDDLVRKVKTETGGRVPRQTGNAFGSALGAVEPLAGPELVNVYARAPLADRKGFGLVLERREVEPYERRPFRAPTLIVRAQSRALLESILAARHPARAARAAARRHALVVDRVRAAGVIAPRRYTVTIAREGPGTGLVTSSPAGVECAREAYCSGAFTDGSSVTLLAASAPGSRFASWEGVCSREGTCTLTVSSNLFVSARFEAVRQEPPPPPPPHP